ncbi:chromosome segregation ATPase [Cenarchaeum symbiosum A]|uniref:Chromosome segregation ATPase n=1 Tax=Cenarchaeum symbiosum (strain A) TaxID=414004 RepID=A0RUJ7_CENSY|nr:chromosome segregation ATPase [Cenarchaeum symbiosum A]
MVHIRKVEIFGFKSFGFRNTSVEFRPGLVSISGPNGSGKSNILDAIIFALGENRPKAMRVGRLSGLMHDIEGSRRGPKMTRASVHFDNSDRRIPVDSDTVEVTREMAPQGESVYYLNKKKSPRGAILDLLDMAGAGLSQLNVVQQGTVTRISEFSPEEKREAIENLIGLSYFDEKKAESVKQLSDADQRLAIALAKMGEIKKRIDELEVERNHKLRHDMIEEELGRLRAVSAADKLRHLGSQKVEKSAELAEVSASAAAQRSELDGIREELKSAEGEKAAYMESVEGHGREKAAFEGELGSALRSSEEHRSGILTAERRVERINARIPEIDGEAQELRGRLESARSAAAAAAAELAAAGESRQRAEAGVSGVNTERDAALSRQSEAAKKRSAADAQMREVKDRLGEARLETAQARARLDDAKSKEESNSSKRGEYARDCSALRALQGELAAAVEERRASADSLRGKLEGLEAKKIRTGSEVEELGFLLEKSGRAAGQYDAKLRLVRGMMHEEYSAAKLRESARELGILGQVYELISWDEKDERAVMAAGSDWIKATVVEDLATLAGLAGHMRERGLPKLRIIPLEALPRLRPAPPEIEGAAGLLSDRIKCGRRYSALKEFLFGNVVVADSVESAHRISRAGYRSVTLGGEYYEAGTAAAVIDISSRISKLARVISMSSSVEGLVSAVSMLKGHVEKRRGLLKRAEGEILACRDELQSAETGLAATEGEHRELGEQAARKERVRDQMAERIAELSSERGRLEEEINVHETLTASLVAELEQAASAEPGADPDAMAAGIDALNAKRSELERLQAEAVSAFGRASESKAGADAAASGTESALRVLDTEKSGITAEAGELAAKAAISKEQLAISEEQLVKLRGREQEFIEASAESVGRMKEYDGRLSALNARDREVSAGAAKAERRRDALERDLSSIEEGMKETQTVLDMFGFGGDLEYFDVGPMLRGLEAEQRSLQQLNARAPEVYADVTDGYRSMSSRKNSLEGERNRIVGFIEGIEREKKQTFLDAFDKVDREIKNAFSKMTGGSAWLELQNEDDIFSSGISYMIQFQNKPKRESTSISGGEKTLAAVVFVLALQKLKPSPFYLFDEVDAHLDAPNSEKLAKILEERARESQFIMVSLKDSVVRRASLIYGVFPKGGVSHVVSYRDKRLPSMAPST